MAGSILNLENVDLTQFPEVSPKEGNLAVVGDGHGSFLKLLHAALKLGVVSFPDNTGIISPCHTPEGAYAKLVEIYKKSGRKQRFIRNGKTLESTELALADIHEQLEELFPGKIDISDLFDNPTVRELAAFLKTTQAA